MVWLLTVKHSSNTNCSRSICPNFVRKKFSGMFIKNYADISATSYPETSRTASIYSSDRLKEGFEKLKMKLTIVPVFPFPYFEKQSMIDTKASSIAFEALFFQPSKSGRLSPSHFSSHPRSEIP